MADLLPEYRVKARNTSAGGENPMHDDAGARARGFPGALVPGVTVYAYMTQPLAAAFGAAWLTRGTASVRFVKPVLEGEELTVSGTVISRDPITCIRCASNTRAHSSTLVMPVSKVCEAHLLQPNRFYEWQRIFFENGVDFSAPEFLSFSASGPDHGPVSSPARPHGDLLLLGGGKDSAVALELLEQSSPGLATMVLNPIRPAIESAAIAGLGGPLVARRTIDPLLLELNRQGYLNGHTPFSAYLAFLGVFVAALHGLRQAIVANERGAGEESLIYRGLPINHQYSKSVHFERRFREYCARHLTPDVSYFSYLRPLYDLQVAALFAKFPQHHLSFRSCNVGQKTDSWCGNCPKCAYVYLSLFPFLGEEDLSRIFGADLFTHPEIQHHIKALVGLEGHKPFECVGTVEESVVAVELGIAKCLAGGTPCPPFLKAVAEALGIDDAAVNGARSWLARNWGSEHFLPETYSGELRTLVTR